MKRTPHYAMVILFLVCIPFGLHGQIPVETLQKWATGEEIELHKQTRIGWLIPWNYKLRERFDLSRASQFRVVALFEKPTASVTLPIFGRFSVGKDTGLAFVTCHYRDSEGTPQKLAFLTEYRISGVVFKEREVIQTHFASLQGP